MTMMLPKSTEYQRAMLSADDFWLLADAGVFQGFAKTELIEGEIYVVNSVHSRHARAHAVMTAELVIAVRSGVVKGVVFSNPSTNLTSDSVPEPDVALAIDSEERAIPGPNLQLAIEISDSTLSFDMGRKLRLYARAGVPEYWVVDVNARRIHRHADPEGEAYRDVASFIFGETVSAVTIAGLNVETAGLT